MSLAGNQRHAFCSAISLKRTARDDGVVGARTVLRSACLVKAKLRLDRWIFESRNRWIRSVVEQVNGALNRCFGFLGFRRKRLFQVVEFRNVCHFGSGCAGSIRFSYLNIIHSCVLFFIFYLMHYKVKIFNYGYVMLNNITYMYTCIHN